MIKILTIDEFAFCLMPYALSVSQPKPRGDSRDDSCWLEPFRSNIGNGHVVMRRHGRVLDGERRSARVSERQHRHPAQAEALARALNARESASE